MNKQQFDMDIQAADNNSLRIGAANRIVQLLQKLRYSNNENSAKRWIWELCQNAKDVCNSTGKVKISINYDEMQRKVFFRHNGKVHFRAPSGRRSVFKRPPSDAKRPLINSYI